MAAVVAAFSLHPTHPTSEHSTHYSHLRRRPRQLVQTCDFEGHVTWVLGVGNPKRFRVVELTNPSRIVVDVKH